MSESLSQAKTKPAAYSPRGAAWGLLHNQAGEVLISGAAGTGKSVASLFKLHLCCDSMPNVRALIVRKTRASVTESALVTFEQFVLPAEHPARTGPRRAFRQAYRYPNGSEIIIGGLDKPSRIMSTEYDLVFVQEAIEIDEGAWESITTRLRNGSLGYQQLLADTNPDRPTHWLKLRCDAGKTVMLESRHEDNPLLWDADRKAWTQIGTTYLAKLDALTGPRKQRLRYGRWVQAEGVVYEGWDAAKHLINPMKIPYDWPRFWCIDFGYTNPFVWQAWAQDPDGRLYRYRELYQTQKLVEDHARAILDATKDEPRPRAIICDHDAEDRATLERHIKIGTIAATKDVSPGIQAVASRLRNADDGKPRIFFVRDSLVSRDPALQESKQPACTEEEFDSYVWDVSTGRTKGEEPVKKHDHGMDAMRYLVAHFDLRPQRKLWAA